VETLLTGRDVVWSLDFLPDGRLLFTEKKGALSVFDPVTRKVTPLTGMPTVESHGQGGLLDVRVHPDSGSGTTLFISHARKAPGGYTTALVRARLRGNALVEAREIFAAVPATGAGQHFGSRIAFAPDGKSLFLSVGDRGERKYAQDLSVHPGKVLRLDLDGKAPADNPFVGRAGARPEIWSYGNRNIQGMQVHPATGALWAHEHGPRGGDEINRIEKGANYGWPTVTFGREYWGPRVSDTTARQGIEPPQHQYTPSIAPSGLAIYTGDAIPEWKGSFLVGSLVLQHLNVWTPGNRAVGADGKPTGSERRYLEDADERVREVRQGPDGRVWLSTDSGKILRLSR
jgi:glucose/arabinose dehydrogenase